MCKDLHSSYQPTSYPQLISDSCFWNNYFQIFAHKICFPLQACFLLVYVKTIQTSQSFSFFDNIIISLTTLSPPNQCYLKKEHFWLKVASRIRRRKSWNKSESQNLPHCCPSSQKLLLTYQRPLNPKKIRMKFLLVDISLFRHRRFQHVSFILLRSQKFL